MPEVAHEAREATMRAAVTIQIEPGTARLPPPGARASPGWIAWRRPAPPAAGLPARGSTARSRARSGPAASNPPPTAISSDRSQRSIATSLYPASIRMRLTRSSEAKANGRDRRGPAAAIWGRACRLPARRHHPRIVARLAPAGNTTRPDGRNARAYGQRRPRARRRTSRRSATPGDRSLPIERIEVASASAKSSGRPSCLSCPAKVSIGAEMSTPRQKTRMTDLARQRRGGRPAAAADIEDRSPVFTLARSIRSRETGASRISCAACRSDSAGRRTVPIGDLFGHFDRGQRACPYP